jgi:hypothetical protein
MDTYRALLRVNEKTRFLFESNRFGLNSFLLKINNHILPWNTPTLFSLWILTMSCVLLKAYLEEYLYYSDKTGKVLSLLQTGMFYVYVY